MGYHRAYICTNGHCVSAYGVSGGTNFCEICGAEVISTCMSCGNPLRGKIDDPWSYVTEYTVPDYCYHCGEPLPWTKSALETGEELIRDAIELDPARQESLIKYLPDIIKETPRSALAATRMCVALDQMLDATAAGMKQFLIDCACEAVKNQLGL